MAKKLRVGAIGIGGMGAGHLASVRACRQVRVEAVCDLNPAVLKEVDDPDRFGVAAVEGDRVVSIIEKPSEPETNLAVTGCYMYDSRVFDVIRGLTPSERNELEITDVNNQYIAWQEMRHIKLKGWWTDAGTRPSLHHAANLVAESRENPVLSGRRVVGELESSGGA